MDKTTLLTAFFKEILILSHRPKFGVKVHLQKNVRMVITDGLSHCNFFHKIYLI